MNMARSLKNPNPVTLAHGQAKQISDQLRGYTFCSACEDRLNKNGEKWVLANIPNDYGSGFPLQDALIPEIPTVIAGDINVYAGRTISKFDVDRLIYFGMSIFWRGAAREWKSSTGAVAPPVDLRGYFEPIRQFLLGERFPDDVFIVALVHNLKPPGNAVIPVESATGRYGDFYWFYVNGLAFALYLGKQTPREVINLCAHHNSCGPVVVDKGFGKMVYGFLKDQLNSSQKSKNLSLFLDNIRPKQQG
jgi:hypothetical protein